MMDVQVPQPLFIGREDVCKALRLGIFTDRFDPIRRFCSLVGPNNIGKTYLIGHLSQELKDLPNVYYFKTSLMGIMTFGEFWRKLVLRFQKTIPEEKLRSAPHPDPAAVEEILKVYQFFQDNIPSGEAGDTEATLNLNDLFEYYTSLGIRIIITIDEFDRAMDLFAENRLFYDYLFDLSPKSGNQYNLSVVIISRRTAGTIAGDLKRGDSNFADAFPTKTLRGFSNAELEAYFDTYRELALPQELLAPEGGLSPEVRQKILFFCGRSPGLLMWMRGEIDEAVQLGQKEIDIARIAHTDSGTIRNVYQRMCELMRNEKMSSGISSMNVFYQHFIGPICNDEAPHRENVKRLFDCGFITETFAGEKDIFELSGIQSADNKGRDDKAPAGEDAPSYEPLSPHFVAYVKTSILNDDLTELGRLLEETEKEVRRIIADGLHKQLGKDWKLELEKFAQPNQDFYAQNMMRLNTAGAEVSKLNVMTFREYYAIIEAYWTTDISSYFPCGRNDLKRIMVGPADTSFDVPLCDARNVNGHLNREILGSIQRERLTETCKALLQGMQNRRSAPLPPLLARPQVKKAPTQEQMDELLGMTTVTLEALKAGACGNLRGSISGCDFDASLSRAYLKSKEIFNAADYVSKIEPKSITVKLRKWDYNAGLFIAQFPESTEP